jgi:cell fate (sporulation/competence/biofilm development) regulator YlbF (YheA/YmcA/DUF963 family)
MNQDVINKVYDLIDEIKSLESYQKRQEIIRLIDNNHHIKDKIEAFNQAKESYLEAKKYGSYHPDLEQYKLKLSQTKELLFNVPEIKALKQYEKELQALLDHVSREIGLSISKHVPIPNEIGLIQKVKGDTSGR